MENCEEDWSFLVNAEKPYVILLNKIMILVKKSDKLHIQN